MKVFTDRQSETQRDKELETMIKNANSYSSMDQRIESIQVSKSDRQIAKEHMRDADSVADLVCRAAESLRSVGQLLNGIFANRVR